MNTVIEYLSGASISSGSLIGSTAAVLSRSGYVDNITISLSGGAGVINTSNGETIITVNKTYMKWIASNPQKS